MKPGAMAPEESWSPPPVRILAHRVAGACAGGVLLVLACRPVAAPREFRIGVLAADGAYFSAAVHGARLAATQLNAAGGVRVGGVLLPVTLVERNYGSDSAGASAAARALIEQDRVEAIVGPQLSDHAIAAGRIAEAAGVPLISPMASDPLLTANRRFVSRLAFLDPVQGTVLATYAYQALKARRAAVLYDSLSVAARNIADLFVRAFVSRGGELAEIQSYRASDGRDFRPALGRMLAARPDVILLPNVTGDDSVQVRQARALGYRGQFLGGDLWDPQALRHIAEAVGSIVVYQWNPASPDSSSRAFVREFTTMFGETPRVTTAATYDAVRLLARAAERAGSLDGGAIADSVRSARPFRGAAATYRFNGTGDPKRGAVLVRIGAMHDSVVAAVETP